MAAGARLPDEPRTPSQWYVTGRGTARLYRTAIRSVLVLELPPPPDMDGARAFKRAARDILRAVRDVEHETRALRRALQAGDRGRADRRVRRLERALEQADRLDLRSTRIAREYGMDECGDDGSDPKAPDDLDLGPEL